jgi:hypothetical protein
VRASLLARLSPLRGRGPDWRSPRAIDADVEEELRFHLDEATAEGVRAGLSREAARAAAFERFGDLASIKEQCVAIRTEGGATVIKALIGLVVGLTAVAMVLLVRLNTAQAARAEAVEARAMALEQTARAEALARELAEKAQAAENPSNARDASTWLARFRVEPDSWRLSWAVSQELVAALSADDAAAVMLEVFPQLSVPQREQALKPFVFHGGHPRALDVLDLAFRDPAASVRERARSYLREYAFVMFKDGDPRYDQWRAATRALALREVLTRGLIELVARLRAAQGGQLLRELHELHDVRFSVACAEGMDPSAILASAGLRDFVEGLVHVRTFEFEGEQVLEIDGAIRPELLDEHAASVSAHFAQLGLAPTILSNWLSEPCDGANGVPRDR